MVPYPSPDQTGASPLAPTGTPLPLAGSHAVVTGGGSGIGSAIARELARLGAELTLIGRRTQPLEEQREHLIACYGRQPQILSLDLTADGDLSAALAPAVQQLGPVAILINNAGASESAPFLKTGVDQLQRMLDVNLTQAFRCTQAVLPAMLAAKYGRVITIASTAGLIGYGYVSAYCAAKHAVIGLTRALAREIARSGVTVNAVCPGFTDTELVGRAVQTIVAKTGRSAQDAVGELSRTNPLGRLIDPAEVAAAVGWLCLPSSGAITGQSIAVAGGEVM